MTEQELSEKIAKAMEPEPEFSDTYGGGTYYSKDGWWAEEWHPEGTKRWARSIREPEICLRLLKIILAKSTLEEWDQFWMDEGREDFVFEIAVGERFATMRGL